MLLKKMLLFFEIFLPEQLLVSADTPLVYKGRVIVATSVVSAFITLALLISFIFLHLSSFLYVGVFLCFITLCFHLYFLSRPTKNFEKNLHLGASLQITVLSILVYLTTFSSKGTGFFGLIWLIPIFLMTAFYFSTRFSFYFAFFNLVLFLGISYFKFDTFYMPLKNLPNFNSVFLVFLTFNIIFTYMMAFLFVYLSEELQMEVRKQRDLLVESAKFQSLGQMASNLAHDINNPLFMIQGKLHQMRNLLLRDQLDLEKCDQIVESVETTLLKLSQIVKGISTFAREGRGDQMVSIGVSELIEGNLALAIDRIKNSGIELEIHVDPKSNLICYPSFISQMLLNLLNNAIDALENAPVKKIEVNAFGEKDWIHIKVSDTGAGIPKEYEKKIFDPFFTTKKFGKGTGLGLSISKGLVEVHEGELSYERVDNKTIFTVRLPRYE